MIIAVGVLGNGLDRRRIGTQSVSCRRMASGQITDDLYLIQVVTLRFDGAQNDRTKRILESHQPQQVKCGNNATATVRSALAGCHLQLGKSKRIKPTTVELLYLHIANLFFGILVIKVSFLPFLPSKCT